MSPIRCAVLALALLAPAAALAQDEEVLARDLREEVHRIPVSVQDRYGRQETRNIPVTVFRPGGGGPFPLVILNHGRSNAEKRALPRRVRFEQMARYFVGKGFAVVVPTRVGYGETYGDFDPEYSDACKAPRIEPMSMAASDQVMAALALAGTLPDLDTSRWIVAGVSVGGLTAVTTVWRHPPGLLGGINFVGGTGGDPDTQPGRPCATEHIARLWREKAAQASVPMLWLYWQNDLYWGPDQPRRWHEAWVQGGGKAQFHSLPPVGTDGHHGPANDMDHWAPIAEGFLARLGFNTPGLPSRPAASGFATVLEADKVPLSPAAREAGYRRFLESRPPRAYAIGSKGAWGWASGDWAIGRALGNCQRRGSVCRLYAVDDEVVWTAPTLQEK